MSNRFSPSRCCCVRDPCNCRCCKKNITNADLIPTFTLPDGPSFIDYDLNMGPPTTYFNELVSTDIFLGPMITQCGSNYAILGTAPLDPSSQTSYNKVLVLAYDCAFHRSSTSRVLGRPTVPLGYYGVTSPYTPTGYEQVNLAIYNYIVKNPHIYWAIQSPFLPYGPFTDIYDDISLVTDGSCYSVTSFQLTSNSGRGAYFCAFNLCWSHSYASLTKDLYAFSHQIIDKDCCATQTMNGSSAIASAHYGQRYTLFNGPGVFDDGVVLTGTVDAGLTDDNFSFDLIRTC